ncbi:essential recombination function protein [Oceanobacillus oncorhynchi subsp. incaldanensis]|uniref:ERF family protein n=1 Tax=Oceanobacillus oncorhynchi TaxID=545501 RepID=UPI001B2057B9|nr:ERF family protein [Oceanobacillus oncorhynchi]GIO18113.1 essential recombination function protein [Oceanobacillus oncorhynchi subsp. incaldanensis]
MIFSESNTKIAPALAKAWAEIENPKHNSSVKVKTKSGSSYTFDYTDLGGILDEAKKVFKENGLTIIQNAYTSISDSKNLISVETMILHSSGEYVKSEPLQMAANTSIQDMGGQVTYMKRYSLSAMLGIATEKDDDANGASGNDYQQNNQQQYGSQGKSNQPKGSLSENQIKRLYAIAKSASVPANDVKSAITQLFNKTDPYQLTKQEYDAICKRLEEKKGA